MTMREDPPSIQSFTTFGQAQRGEVDFRVPAPEGMCIDEATSGSRRKDEQSRGSLKRNDGSEVGIKLGIRRMPTIAHSATTMSTTNSNSSTSSSSTFASKSSGSESNYTFAGHRPSLPSIANITNPQPTPSLTAVASAPRWPPHFHGSPQMKRLAAAQTLPPLPPFPTAGRESYEPSQTNGIMSGQHPPTSLFSVERSYSSTSPLLRPLRLPLPEPNGYTETPSALVITGRENNMQFSNDIDSRRSSSAYDEHDDDDIPLISPGYQSSTSSRVTSVDEERPREFNSRKRVKTWSPSSTPTTTTTSAWVAKMGITEEEDGDMKDDEASPKGERSLSEASTALEKDSGDISEPLTGQSGITLSNYPRWLQLWNSGLKSDGDRSLYEDKTPASDITALHIAIRTGKVDIVRLLVSSGASMTRVTAKGETPLHFAAALKDSSALEYLLSLANSVEYSRAIVDALHQRDYLGRTPLLVAARDGTLRSVQALLQAGSVVNGTKSLGGLNILSHAVRGNNVEVLDYFLSGTKGVRPNISVKGNLSTYTPLQDAAANGHFGIVELLLKNGAEVNIGPTEPYDLPILSAIRRRNRDMLMLLIKYKASVNIKGVFHEAPLHVAVKMEDEVIIEIILENGGKWDEKDGNGETPLHIAAKFGYYGCAKLLIMACGAPSEKINVTDGNDRTPLHAAASAGNYMLVELLMAAGSNPNAADLDGLTPLHLALQNVKQTNIDLISLLLNKADVGAGTKTSKGETLLHLVAASGNAELARTLLGKQDLSDVLDIDSRTLDGLTALHVAVENQKVAVVSELLKAGCDPKILNKKGQSPLHIAVSSENFEMIKLLIEQGADLNMPIGATDSDAGTERYTPPACKAPFTNFTSTTTSSPPSTTTVTMANGKPKSYKCPHCNILIKPPKMNLQRHIAQLHREKVRFACPYPGCNVTTSRQDNWKMHLRRHEEKRKKEKERYKEMARGSSGKKVKEEQIKSDDDEMKH